MRVTTEIKVNNLSEKKELLMTMEKQGYRVGGLLSPDNEPNLYIHIWSDKTVTHNRNVFEKYNHNIHRYTFNEYLSANGLNDELIEIL